MRRGRILPVSVTKRVRISTSLWVSESGSLPMALEESLLIKRSKRANFGECGKENSLWEGALLVRGVFGEVEVKGAAVARVTFDARAATEFLDDADDDGEAEAVALAVGAVQAVEGDEEAALLFFGEAVAVVFNVGADEAVFEALAADEDLRGLAAILDGVADVVGPDFFDPWGVTDGAGPGVLKEDFGLALVHEGAEALDGFLCDGAGVYGDAGDFGLADGGEHEKLADDVVELQARLVDVAEHFRDVFGGKGLPVVGEDFGEADDAVERGAEVVSDGVGEGVELFDEVVFGGVLLREGFDGLAEVEVDFEACEDFVLAEGFCDVVHGARFEAFDFVFGFGEGRHEDDGDVFEGVYLLHAAAGFKAVYAWHHDVEQDGIGRDVAYALESAFTRFCSKDAVARGLELIVKDGQVGGGIVNN